MNITVNILICELLAWKCPTLQAGFLTFGLWLCYFAQTHAACFRFVMFENSFRYEIGKIEVIVLFDFLEHESSVQKKNL